MSGRDSSEPDFSRFRAALDRLDDAVRITTRAELSVFDDLASVRDGVARYRSASDAELRSSSAGAPLGLGRGVSEWPARFALLRDRVGWAEDLFAEARGQPSAGDEPPVADDALGDRRAFWGRVKAFEDYALWLDAQCRAQGLAVDLGQLFERLRELREPPEDPSAPERSAEGGPGLVQSLTGISCTPDIERLWDQALRIEDHYEVLRRSGVRLFPYKPPAAMVDVYLNAVSEMDWHGSHPLAIRRSRVLQDGSIAYLVRFLGERPETEPEEMIIVGSGLDPVPPEGESMTFVDVYVTDDLEGFSREGASGLRKGLAGTHRTEELADRSSRRL